MEQKLRRDCNMGENLRTLRKKINCHKKNCVPNYNSALMILAELLIKNMNPAN